MRFVSMYKWDVIEEFKQKLKMNQNNFNPKTLFKKQPQNYIWQVFLSVYYIATGSQMIPQKTIWGILLLLVIYIYHLIGRDR